MSKGNPLWETSYHSRATIQIKKIKKNKKTKQLMELGHLCRQRTSTELDKGIVLPFLLKFFCKEP